MSGRVNKMDSKALSQERYTQYAQEYMTSKAHTQGAELERSVEIAQQLQGGTRDGFQ